MSSDDPANSRFLREALPSIASYLHGITVDLDDIAAGVRSDDRDEFDEFFRIIRLRHAISCTKQLADPLGAVEQQVSTASLLTRAESRGAIRGRLDIPHYLAQRARNHSWPRRYPLLINESVTSTPENLLIRGVLDELMDVLSAIGLPTETAERRAATLAYRWLHQRKNAMPWRELSKETNLKRLRVETENRIRRRQTGNDAAYSELLKWLDEWRMHPSSGDPTFNLQASLMAFPTESFFWDRVFEIWCLLQVANAIERSGASLTVGPRSLALRKIRPIFDFDYQGDSIQVWFQRSLPSSDATWRYTHNNQMLRGIPDIAVTRNQAHSLIVDAKNRMALGLTRSEETYKMLGYLENFRPHFAGNRFVGALIFLSKEPLGTGLTHSSTSGELFLCGANPDSGDDCRLHLTLDRVIHGWLADRSAS